MAPIQVSDLEGVDGDIALRVIAYAALICPSLQDLTDGQRDIALAILRAASDELADMPRQYVASESDGPFRTGYTTAQVRSAFSSADLEVLRSFCTRPARGPIGYFPSPSKALLAEWPE